MTELEPIARAAAALAERAVAAMQQLTRGGEAIDDHQVVVERVAYAATEARAIAALVDLRNAARAGEAGASTTDAGCGEVAAAELATSLRNRLEPVAPALGLTLGGAYTGAAHAAIARGLAPSAVAAVGDAALEVGGRMPWRDDDVLAEVRANVRAFADREVVPHAERIHRNDELVPERLVEAMARAGYFGLSIPAAYGGHELGNPAMIVTTEELSRASLAAAGSLITRPEILAKALLAGGTEAQKRALLPALASGAMMVAISVTEPDTGSDVASLSCRAERARVDGRDGWAITGAKAWCTFAGRADAIALLARTGERSGSAGPRSNAPPGALRSSNDGGARGLTLFVVAKPRFDGHDFEVTQPGGGTLTGRADRTPGYRGMHSFSLQFDRFLVDADAVVGGDAGIGRGFALQMAGFAAGRLQTGGRACGVIGAALEQTCAYVASRRQFGKRIGDYELTRYYLGRMAARLAASRAITYAAAAAMDDAGGATGRAGTMAAMAKLYASDAAVEVTQLGQLLHGGWGYAEDYPISRLVADAQVLPIFEGVRPILALKVIGRALARGEA